MLGAGGFVLGLSPIGWAAIERPNLLTSTKRCCGQQAILPEGARAARGPFTCELKAGEVTCTREDGHGFAIGDKRGRVLRP